MMRFVQGNLLESQAEALVNSVNTVGVMGKGIALMFKEAFPGNFRVYEDACKRNDVRVGRMFVTENQALEGPRLQALEIQIDARALLAKQRVERPQ